jgi:hypothetical protein
MTKRIYKKRPRKPGSTWGLLSDKIIATITELGPMTRAELCQHLNHDAESVSSVIARLRKATKERPQRLYISGWVYDQEGQRPYPRAQFDLGAEPDKLLKRRTSVKQRHADLVSEKLRRMKMSSVFNMGMSRNQLTARAKESRSGELQQH